MSLLNHAAFVVSSLVSHRPRHSIVVRTNVYPFFVIVVRAASVKDEEGELYSLS